MRWVEVKSFQRQRHDIALVIQRRLDFAAEQIRRVAATLHCGRGEQNKKMGLRLYVLNDNALEVATSNAGEIHERFVAVVCQILNNSERPRNIGTPIAEKNSFLDECHSKTIR